VILKKMLVRNASLYKPDAIFLDELSHQVVKIGNLLIWSGKRMINHEMDLRWVPHFRDTHLAEDFDRKRSGAVLSHRKVDGQYGNVSRAIDIARAIGSDANDLLGEGQRLIAQDVLTQRCSEAARKLVAIKRESNNDMMESS
jgi:hypothetical protein